MLWFFTRQLNYHRGGVVETVGWMPYGEHTQLYLGDRYFVYYQGSGGYNACFQPAGSLNKYLGQYVALRCPVAERMQSDPKGLFNKNFNPPHCQNMNPFMNVYIHPPGGFLGLRIP